MRFRLRRPRTRTTTQKIGQPQQPKKSRAKAMTMLAVPDVDRVMNMLTGSQTLASYPPIHTSIHPSISAPEMSRRSSNYYYYYKGLRHIYWSSPREPP